MDAKEPIDLERVDDAIKQAHQAEDRLLEIAPGSINPAEDEEGGPSATRGDESATQRGGDDSAAQFESDETRPDPTGSPRAPSDKPR